MFGFLLSFFFFTKQQQGRKTVGGRWARHRGADRKGPGTRGRHWPGAPRAGWPGALSSILGELRRALVGADKREWAGRRLSPGQWQSAGREAPEAPRVWGPGLQSTGPQGLDRREEAGRASTEGLSCSGDPPGTPGPRWARATRILPCVSANQLLQEGLQLVLVLDAHELVHHIPVLDGQHGRHGGHLIF